MSYDFFISHYIFRWRTAMNDFYMSKWAKLRHIEGASQRVQEDTMRFSTTLEGLGISLINSVMTLVFLPILPALVALRDRTAVHRAGGEFALLAGAVLVGVRDAPAGDRRHQAAGAEFSNQRVEAAYRKELVYGEDHAERAEPPTCQRALRQCAAELFPHVFPLHVFQCRPVRYPGRRLFLGFMLMPTIVAGTITYGIFQQISTAFGQVS